MYLCQGFVDCASLYYLCFENAINPNYSKPQKRVNSGTKKVQITGWKRRMSHIQSVLLNFI